MGMKSKRKGKVGEREAAEALREVGIDARRGVQYQGGEESPDVVAEIPGVHFEVKRTERFRLYAALRQAIEECGGAIPVVLHRANREEWVAIVRLADLPNLATQVYLTLAQG